MTESPGAQVKAPARSAAEIRADIERERAALSGSFESLRGHVDAALGESRRRAVDAGAKAKVIAPVVAGLVATLAVVRLLARRRARRKV